MIPPGIVILLGGALLVGLARWRWAPAVGAFLGLFIIVGFLLSPSGVPNLLGENGAGAVVGTVFPDGGRAGPADRRGSRHLAQTTEARSPFGAHRRGSGLAWKHQP